ncbi:MAG: VOC family protein [Gammaproteobacteria bacterium]|jgi:uncharacterized protein
MINIVKNKVLCSILLLLGLVFPIQYAFSAPTLPPLNNPATDKQLTGKFVWFDLATLDLEKQKAFYSSVFGWTYQPISNTEEHYTLIKNGERNVAGMFTVKQREGSKLGALWVGLMSHDDPAKAVSTVESNGGSVHTKPKAIPKRGTYALFVDPEGALFGVLKSDSGDPLDSEVAIGDFFWMDLFAREPSQAGQFYQKVASYEISKSEAAENVERLVLNSHDKARAGVVPLPQDANRAGWLPYVRVADVEATLKKVTNAGGYVMVPPTPELLDGNLAIFVDPQGGVLGIVRWDEPQADKE